MSSTATATATATAAAAPPLRQVGAVVIGNALEFYDFVTYTFFAIQIGHAFFPSDNPTSSLLMSLATFGAGFLMRPIGGIVIGRMGDRLGRKPAMLLSFGCMGFAMIGLALTPSFASIGLLAPILVILFRLLQGFALGGEVGPTTAYLIEAAPVARRGLYGSLQIASQGLAVLVAGVVGIVLARVLSDAELMDWGWRIPFLIGTLIVPFGLYIRGRLPETLESTMPVSHAIEDRTFAAREARGTRRVALLGLAMISSGTIATYVLAYLTTYATTTLELRSDVAFGAAAILGLADLCIAPLSGHLSDRWGRKRLMLLPWVLLFVLTLPAFLLITHVTTSMTLLAAMAVLATLKSLAIPAALIAMTEAIPAASRSGTVALTYALAVAIFGGTAQFIVAWLTDVTGNPLAPAWYMTAAIAVGVAAMVAMHETAPAHATVLD